MLWPWAAHSPSEPQGPHLENTRTGLVSTSVVFQLCFAAEARAELPSWCVMTPWAPGACSGWSPQGQVPYALSLFTCALQMASFSKHQDREQVGKHWLVGAEWVGFSPVVRVSLWRLLCTFSKGIPLFKILLPSAGKLPYSQLWKSVDTRKWGVPARVRHLAFCTAFLAGPDGALGPSLPQRICFLCCIHWGST